MIPINPSRMLTVDRIPPRTPGRKAMTIPITPSPIATIASRSPNPAPTANEPIAAMIARIEGKLYAGAADLSERVSVLAMLNSSHLAVNTWIKSC